MNQHSFKPIHNFVIKAANEKLAINELVLLLWVIKGKVASFTTYKFESKLFSAHCIERHAESTYNTGKLGFWIVGRNKAMTICCSHLTWCEMIKQGSYLIITLPYYSLKLSPLYFPNLLFSQNRKIPKSCQLCKT